MRHFDLSPLYRSTVGFDRLFSLLDNVSGLEQAQGQAYPPYNIERRGENDYRITLAVAGFSEADITIESRENTLSIRGAKSRPAPTRRRSQNSCTRASRPAPSSAASSSPITFW